MNLRVPRVDRHIYSHAYAHVDMDGYIVNLYTKKREKKKKKKKKGKNGYVYQ